MRIWVPIPLALLVALLASGLAEGRELGKGSVADPLPPVGPRLYQCFQFPDNRLPVIDGDLSDWELVGGEYAQDTYGLIEYNRKIGRGYDLNDLDVRVRTGYSVSTNRIYVAVEYWDDFHNFDRLVTTPNNTNPGNDDIFELVVDADNSGGDFIDGLDPRHMSTHTQNYHIYAHERDGEHVWVWGPQHWLGEAPYSQWASHYDQPHGTAGLSTLEFYVTPFNYAHSAGLKLSAPAQLAVGDTIGLDYSILDRDDDEPQVCKFWALADTILMYRNADFLPDFVLAPIEPKLSVVPVVEFRSRAPGAKDPHAVQFANMTTGEVSGFRWDFGDGEESTEKEPLHRYQQPGRYTVTLEANHGQGSCRKRKLDYVLLPQ